MLNCHINYKVINNNQNVEIKGWLDFNSIYLMYALEKRINYIYKIVKYLTILKFQILISIIFYDV